MLLRVRDEMEAARFALSIVLRDWHLHLAAAPSPSGSVLSHADLRHSLDGLEITYTLRLFGAWEAVLRDYWLHGLGRMTDPDLKPLVNSVAARCKVAPSRWPAFMTCAVFATKSFTRTFMYCDTITRRRPGGYQGFCRTCRRTGKRLSRMAGKSDSVQPAPICHRLMLSNGWISMMMFSVRLSRMA
jgi:hypothetical protein